MTITPDETLQIIAADDIVNVEWVTLRDIIKQKVNDNITSFLSDNPPPPPPLYDEQVSTNGGLRLPPFPDKRLARPLNLPIPINYMNPQQANELKDTIFALLDDFDSNPPFTIQRVAELCLTPRKHYTTLGKYLRALEKSLLVTSSQMAFPTLDDVDKDPTGRSVFSLGSTRHSAPSTPLFSPIPFLHEDARRSKSRSPPPSPLTLGPAAQVAAAAANADVSPIQAPAGQEDVKALGLVDELDDPSPGHMSDHPVALSATTTTEETSEKSTPGFMPTLEQRFVQAEQKAEDKEESKAMDEDKENTT